MDDRISEVSPRIDNTLQSLQSTLHAEPHLTVPSAMWYIIGQGHCSHSMDEENEGGCSLAKVTERVNAPLPSTDYLSQLGFPPATWERLCVSTWAVEGIAQPIVVVPLEEGEADVSRACGWGFPELQC